GANLISRGAIKVPDASPQLGFQAVFAPTGLVDRRKGLISTFPDLDNPKVFLGAFTGDLGLDQGLAQNVFSLDTSRLTQLGIAPLREGQTWRLPEGKGSITFDGVVRWASFVVATDHAELIVLAGALLAILGLLLSLFIPRRRLFLRIVGDEASDGGEADDGADSGSGEVRAIDRADGSASVELAGLVRSGADTLGEDIAAMTQAIGGRQAKAVMQ
ncbi:MAG: cytochrome c biogenesis protein ResB, partial [Actinobacteria bacterium]|nr:cytochrome c biogenesis protein ResB [Actinomycetota bacterium]